MRQIIVRIGYFDMATQKYVHENVPPLLFMVSGESGRFLSLDRKARGIVLPTNPTIPCALLPDRSDYPLSWVPVYVTATKYYAPDPVRYQARPVRLEQLLNRFSIIDEVVEFEDMSIVCLLVARHLSQSQYSWQRVLSILRVDMDKVNQCYIKLTESTDAFYYDDSSSIVHQCMVYNHHKGLHLEVTLETKARPGRIYGYLLFSESGVSFQSESFMDKHASPMDDQSQERDSQDGSVDQDAIATPSLVPGMAMEPNPKRARTLNMNDAGDVDAPGGQGLGQGRGQGPGVEGPGVQGLGHLPLPSPSPIMMHDIYEKIRLIKNQVFNLESLVDTTCSESKVYLTQAASIKAQLPVYQHRLMMQDSQLSALTEQMHAVLVRMDTLEQEKRDLEGTVADLRETLKRPRPSPGVDQSHLQRVIMESVSASVSDAVSKAFSQS
jgi:hypothetical protein